jgi:chemotaxis protein MotA
MMNNRVLRILYGFGIAAVLQILIYLLSIASQNAEPGTVLNSVNRLSILLGSDFINGGYIQFLTFFFFWWGILEIKHINNRNNFEKKYLDYDLLPNEENVVIGEKEINRIRIKVYEYLDTRNKERKSDYILLNLIKKACTKFRSDSSVSDAFNMVVNQTKINIAKSESAQSYIRYIAWAIPSIGFIGTVVGISGALGAVSESTEKVVSLLSVAFDTTLVALILSVIIMWLIHSLQEVTEKTHSDFEEYVMDNLINKMDVS